MRSNIMKDMAEACKEEYDEYVNDCMEINMVPVDIWSWIAEQIITAEDYRNDQMKDDTLTEGENNANEKQVS